jgi:ribosome-binding factor A
VELSDIIQRKLKDPRRGFLTLTGVEVSKDLHVAKVYVSALSEDELNAAMETLKRAKGFLRSELGPRLGLRHVPELHFQPDHSAEHGLRVAEILDELRNRGEFEEEEEG